VKQRLMSVSVTPVILREPNSALILTTGSYVTAMKVTLENSVRCGH
jgi:hypothetical protein